MHKYIYIIYIHAVYVYIYIRLWHIYPGCKYVYMFMRDEMPPLSFVKGMLSLWYDGQRTFVTVWTNYPGGNCVILPWTCYNPGWPSRESTCAKTPPGCFVRTCREGSQGLAEATDAAAMRYPCLCNPASLCRAMHADLVASRRQPIRNRHMHHLVSW